MQKNMPLLKLMLSGLMFFGVNSYGMEEPNEIKVEAEDDGGIFRAEKKPKELNDLSSLTLRSRRLPSVTTFLSVPSEDEVKAVKHTNAAQAVAMNDILIKQAQDEQERNEKYKLQVDQITQAQLDLQEQQTKLKQAALDQEAEMAPMLKQIKELGAAQVLQDAKMAGRLNEIEELKFRQSLSDAKDLPEQRALQKLLTDTKVKHLMKQDDIWHQLQYQTINNAGAGFGKAIGEAGAQMIITLGTYGTFLLYEKYRLMDPEEAKKHKELKDLIERTEFLKRNLEHDQSATLDLQLLNARLGERRILFTHYQQQTAAILSKLPKEYKEEVEADLVKQQVENFFMAKDAYDAEIEASKKWQARRGQPQRSQARLELEEKMKDLNYLKALANDKGSGKDYIPRQRVAPMVFTGQESPAH
jgi:hypothetical protein